jgi:hypothetical protein
MFDSGSQVASELSDPLDEPDQLGSGSRHRVTFSVVAPEAGTSSRSQT